MGAHYDLGPPALFPKDAVQEIVQVPRHSWIMDSGAGSLVGHILYQCECGFGVNCLTWMNHPPPLAFLFQHGEQSTNLPFLKGSLKPGRWQLTRRYRESKGAFDVVDPPLEFSVFQNRCHLA